MLSDPPSVFYLFGRSAAENPNSNRTTKPSKNTKKTTQKSNIAS